MLISKTIDLQYFRYPWSMPIHLNGIVIVFINDGSNGSSGMCPHPTVQFNQKKRIALPHLGSCWIATGISCFLLPLLRMYEVSESATTKANRRIQILFRDHLLLMLCFLTGYREILHCSGSLSFSSRRTEIITNYQEPPSENMFKDKLTKPINTVTVESGNVSMQKEIIQNRRKFKGGQFQ